MKTSTESVRFVFPPKSILCAIDGLESNEAAISTSFKLAQSLKAQLTFFHADSAFLYHAELLETSGAFAVPLVNPEKHASYLLTREAELRASLEKIADKSEFHLKVVSGDPAVSVSNEVRDLGHDLVVLGRKRKGILENFFLGSTANNILEDARVNVLVVPEGALLQKNELREVVLATDLQSADLNAPRSVAHLCRAFGVESTLIHAFEAQDYRTIPRDYFTNAEVYEEISELFQNAHEIKRNSLEREAQHFAEKLEFTCHPKLLEGPLRPSILSYVNDAAKRGQTQMLVVGRFTNRSSFGTWLLGSTARTVAMNAECPVLVVPHQGSE